MLKKLHEITLDGTVYPISFTMPAMEKLEEDLNQSYLNIQITARSTRVILFRGIEEGCRQKGIQLTEKSEELVDKLSLDYQAHDKLWEIFGFFVRKGQPIPGFDDESGDLEEGDPDDDQKKKEI